MSLPCYDPMDDPDDDDIWGLFEEEWRGDEHPEPLPVEWGSIEYLAGPEYRFYKKLSETRWALTPLGEAIRHEVKWPDTETLSTHRPQCPKCAGIPGAQHFFTCNAI